MGSFLWEGSIDRLQEGFDYRNKVGWCCIGETPWHGRDWTERWRLISIGAKKGLYIVSYRGGGQVVRWGISCGKGVCIDRLLEGFEYRNRTGWER